MQSTRRIKMAMSVDCISIKLAHRLSNLVCTMVEKLKDIRFQNPQVLDNDPHSFRKQLAALLASAPPDDFIPRLTD